MQAMKLDVLFAFFCYGGNGGIGMQLPEITEWYASVVQKLGSDDRVGRFGSARFGDIPLTMERNRAVKAAKDAGFDILVMIDSDNVPDLYLNHRPWAVPFWDSSFEFAYQRKLQGLPSVVCAPYCGPPPHPTRGGFENVYVFHSERIEGGEDGFAFESYGRNHAAQMRGIQEIAAGPTGCILYTLDAFDLMPIRQHSKGEILDMWQRGEITKDRALRLLNLESWFFYEFTDQYQTQKASTEDVTNTREIQMAGITKHRQPIVFCNWDAWAGHYKPKCVGMPEPIRVEQVSDVFRAAVEDNVSAQDELRDVDFAGLAPEDQQAMEYEDVAMQQQADWDRQRREMETEDDEDDMPPLPPGIEVRPRRIGDRKVLSVGWGTDESHLQTMKNLVRLVAKSRPQKPLRIAEIGSWVGESAIAMTQGFGQAGGVIYCVDHWLGSSTDKTGDFAAAFEGYEEGIFDYFLRNVGELLGDTVKTLKGTSLDVAASLDGEQDLDLVFVDADHTYEGLKADLEAWWKHVSPDGLMAGHDWCDSFPGVERAVREFFEPLGIEPTVDLESTIWVVNKARAASKTENTSEAVEHDEPEPVDA